MCMSTNIVIPSTLRGAGRELRSASPAPLEQLPKPDFIRAWCAVAYIYPGLHPDGYDDAESRWPRGLKPLAAEAWRRNDAGELEDAEMYPCDSAWAGIFDRLDSFTPQEYERRRQIAAEHGEAADG